MFCGSMGSMILSHAHLASAKKGPGAPLGSGLAGEKKPGLPGCAWQHTAEVSINGVTQNGWFTVCNGKFYIYICKWMI